MELFADNSTTVQLYLVPNHFDESLVQKSNITFSTLVLVGAREESLPM